MKKQTLFAVFAVLSFTCFFHLFSPSLAASGEVSEYTVKSNYLVNFGKFITWPDDAFADANAPFVIGVLGDDPFGNDLDKAVSGETLSGHPFKVKRFESFDPSLAGQLRKCQILFISYSEKDLGSTILKSLQGSPTLTVAEFEGFPVMGGMVTFDQEGQRIGLVLNAASAQKAGLSFRAQLMQVAKIYKK